MEIKTNWMGGKPVGWIIVNASKQKIKVKFSYLIQESIGDQQQTFETKDFDNSFDKTLIAAKIQQKKLSDEHNLTKNLIRYVTLPDNTIYLEVQLQNNLIMKCEVEHLPIIEERIWTANEAADKKGYYVKSRDSTKRDQLYMLFHRCVYKEFAQIDHINRDGLDNRRCNIREGSGRVNANNKGKQSNNTSGTTGVYFENGKSSWILFFKILLLIYF